MAEFGARAPPPGWNWLISSMKEDFDGCNADFKIPLFIFFPNHSTAFFAVK